MRRLFIVSRVFPSMNIIVPQKPIWIIARLNYFPSITAPSWRFRTVTRVFQRSNIVTPWMQLCAYRTVSIILDLFRRSNIITPRRRFRMKARGCCSSSISTSRRRFRIIARVYHESNFCHPEEAVSVSKLSRLSLNIIAPMRQFRTTARAYNSSSITTPMRRLSIVSRVFRSRILSFRRSRFAS